MRLESGIPKVFRPAAVAQDRIVNRPPTLRAAVGACPFPDDLAHEAAIAKNPVHKQLEVMGSRRVAVQVNASRRLQDAPHFQQPNGHHDEVSHHAFAVRLASGLDDGMRGRISLG